MITLYTSSLCIGGVFGFVLGVALSFISSYFTEINIHDKFSEGWDAGVKYGKTVKEVSDEETENKKIEYVPYPVYPTTEPQNPDWWQGPFYVTATNTTDSEHFTPIRDAMTGKKVTDEDTGIRKK